MLILIFNYYIYVIKKLNSVNYGNYQLISLHDIEPVLEQISRIINRGNLNFEDVAEIIDKISSNGYDNLITNNLFNLILYLFDISVFIVSHFYNTLLVRAPIASSIEGRS